MNTEPWMEELARETVLRWRGKLSDPETFEYLYENILAAIQFAYDKAIKIQKNKGDV